MVLTINLTLGTIATIKATATSGRKPWPGVTTFHGFLLVCADFSPKLSRLRFGLSRLRFGNCFFAFEKLENHFFYCRSLGISIKTTSQETTHIEITEPSYKEITDTILVQYNSFEATIKQVIGPNTFTEIQPLDG